MSLNISRKIGIRYFARLETAGICQGDCVPLQGKPEKLFQSYKTNVEKNLIRSMNTEHTQSPPLTQVCISPQKFLKNNLGAASAMQWHSQGRFFGGGGGRANEARDERGPVGCHRTSQNW